MTLPTEPVKSSLRAIAPPFLAPGISGHQAVTDSSSPISSYTPTLVSDPSPANASISPSRTSPIAIRWMASKHFCAFGSPHDGRAPGSTAPIFNWSGGGKTAGTANIWEPDLDYCPCNQDVSVEEHSFSKTTLSSKNRSCHDEEQRVDGASEPGLLMSDEDEELLPEELRRELGMEIPKHAVRFTDLQESAFAFPVRGGRNGNGPPRPLALGSTSPREGSAWGGNRNILGSHLEPKGAGTAQRSSRQRAARRADAAYEIRYGPNYRRIMGRDMQRSF